MTDIEKLNDVIHKKGLKVSFLADNLGLTRNGFYNKKNGKTEFYASEIVKLSTLLQLSAKEREAIFFANKVDNQATLSKTKNRKES